MVGQFLVVEPAKCKNQKLAAIMVDLLCSFCKNGNKINLLNSTLSNAGTVIAGPSADTFVETEENLPRIFLHDQLPHTC